jgi:hypothetical protein
MGNLTDIGHGIGKYLTASDATGIPQIDDNAADLANLHFKLATNNNFVKYNMVDGFFDAFQDTSGVDAGNSTNETRDGTGEYYSGYAAAAITSSGGSAAVDGTDTVTTFTSNGTYTIDTAIDHHFLVVAGGGGGGGSQEGHQGGGGGAGGYRTSYSTSGGGASAESQLALGATSYAITVGTGGGVGSPGACGNGGGSAGGSGTASSIAALKVTVGGGGGGGGQGSSGCSTGLAGGSGGGAAATDSGSGPAGAGTSGEGYAGGTGGSGSGASASGGGASGVGTRAGNNNAAAAVGPGLSNSISGSAVTYASGGSTQNSGGAGDANTGQGGAGGYSSTGHAGGTGIVILRRPTNDISYNNLTLVSNTQTAATAPTTGRIMIFEQASTGTTTINTDIKGWVSRDNGSNYDQITLVSQSEYESGKRILEGSVDFTMASGTNMRYKITTHNQSSTKITRVHGASMLWS